MQQVTLGTQQLKVSRLGLGCMGMSAFYTGSGKDDAGAIKTIHRAVDLGITFFDTAEIYGPYTNEELLGRAFAGRRKDVVIATKFGMLLHRGDGSRGLDGSPENVRLSIEGSLKRLNTDYIDLYYQHRMDPGTPIEETMGVLSEFVRELGIGFVAYSPLGRGFLTGTIRSLDQFDKDDSRRTSPRFKGENLQTNIRIVEQVEAVATEIGAKPGQVALAWVLAQGEDIAPIPGTKRISYLEENVAAEGLTLSPEQLSNLNAVAAPIGDRYADMSTVNR
ncbi:MAG: aldo/keto reductase [Actinobacteria bacterium]|nr:aldo/keto reductase [Actinomycetota bacterium]